MSDDLRHESDKQSDPPFPNVVTTAELTRAMDAIFAMHEKKRAEERHRANSAQQKAVGIISLEQLKLTDKLQDLTIIQASQEKRLGTMETKLDTVISLAKYNGEKAETAAKTSGKTFYEQRVAILGALGTLIWYVVEYFNKH